MKSSKAVRCQSSSSVQRVLGARAFFTIYCTHFSDVQLLFLLRHAGMRCIDPCKLHSGCPQRPTSEAHHTNSREYSWWLLIFGIGCPYSTFVGQYCHVAKDVMMQPAQEQSKSNLKSSRRWKPEHATMRSARWTRLLLCRSLAPQLEDKQISYSCCKQI